MKSYLGVKVLNAKPMNLGDYNTHRGWAIPADEDPKRDGYLVMYPDGYESWSPKDAFESAYLPLENSTKITQAEVDAFLAQGNAQQLDSKTTLVSINTVTGFIQHEVSSCVDPANYDHNLGVELATKRVKDRIWPMLGFVLQWGRYGLNAVERKPF